MGRPEIANEVLRITDEDYIRFQKEQRLVKVTPGPQNGKDFDSKVLDTGGKPWLHQVQNHTPIYDFNAILARFGWFIIGFLIASCIWMPVIFYSAFGFWILGAR